MAIRYVEHFDPKKRVKQDRAYADAMRKLADSTPTTSTSRRCTVTRCF